jgi:hypothetical protein
MKTKRGVSLPADFMGWMILGIVILITVLLISLILRGKLVDGIDYIKSLMRFGRG